MTTNVASFLVLCLSLSSLPLLVEAESDLGGSAASRSAGRRTYDKKIEWGVIDNGIEKPQVEKDSSAPDILEEQLRRSLSAPPVSGARAVPQPERTSPGRRGEKEEVEEELWQKVLREGLLNQQENETDGESQDQEENGQEGVELDLESWGWLAEEAREKARADEVATEDDEADDAEDGDGTEGYRTSDQMSREKVDIFSGPAPPLMEKKAAESSEAEYRYWNAPPSQPEDSEPADEEERSAWMRELVPDAPGRGGRSERSTGLENVLNSTYGSGSEGLSGVMTMNELMPTADLFGSPAGNDFSSTRPRDSGDELMQTKTYGLSDQLFNGANLGFKPGAGREGILDRRPEGNTSERRGLRDSLMTTEKLSR